MNVDVFVDFVHNLGRTRLYNFQVKNPGKARVGSMLRQGIEESMQLPNCVSVCNMGRGQWYASLPLEILAALIAQTHGWTIETDPNPHSIYTE